MQDKKVSIIMNCYNGQDFLKESINSVIDQTYKKWELIFYDNCSTDKSAQIVKKYNDKRIKYYRSKKNLKLGLARKKALSKANGYFVAFLDTDDIWKKNKLKTQLKFLKKKEIGFCISNSIFFNKFKSKNFYSPKQHFKKKVFYELIKNYFISFDTVIIKLRYLKKLNHMIDERFNIIHDMDLLIRLSNISEMNYAPFLLSKWRMREESTSYNNFSTIIKEKKILINKLSRLKKNDSKFKKSKIDYLDILYRQEILLLLSQKKFLKVFGLLKKLKLNMKNSILVILLFFPFKGYIFRNFFNLRY